MKGLTTKDFIKTLTSYVPDLLSRLSPASLSNSWDKLEEKAQVKLPTALKELYEICNGDPSVGMFLGLYFMSQEEVLRTMDLFGKMDTVFVEGQGEHIREDYITNMNLIPFASDEDSCYFVLDYSPAKGGSMGQVIAIDLTYDCSYLAAESLEEFYGLIKSYLEDGRFFISEEEDEIHLEFESGHFFNQLPEILQPGKERMIELPDGFWRDKFKDKLVDGKVPEGVLQKITDLNIEKQTLSCRPFLLMENIKELRIWECELTDFEVLGQIKNLKQLTLGACEVNAEQVLSLSESKSIRTLRFARAKVNGLEHLANLKTLRELILYRIDGVCASELSKLKQLQVLDLDETAVEHYDFFECLPKIKELEIKLPEIANLDFLAYLPNLVQFQMENKAKDETGLCYLRNMKKLKTFQYPVSDMSVYLEHEKLEDIGVSAINLINIEALQNTNISSVMVYDGSSKVECKHIIEEIKKYTHLTSYGFTGQFD